MSKNETRLLNHRRLVMLYSRTMKQPLRSRLYEAIDTFAPETESFRRHVVALGVTFLACGAAAADSGQAPDLDKMDITQLMELEVPKVTSASKFEQTVSEAPSSISVVTSDEFRKFGYRTLAEALQSLQGFHVSYDRNYAFLGTRGLNLGDFNGRVLLLVNGHRVNNNITDGGFIDTAFLIDVDLIDRVEVIRGPGSVLYGNNAFFGVINVLTRKGKQIRGVELSSEYGEFDTFKERVTIGHSFTNGLDVLLSGTFYDSDGNDRLFYKEFNTAAQNHGIARHRDSDTFGSIFGSLSFYDFTLEGGYIGREKANPTAQFGTAFNNPNLRTIDQRGYAALKYAHNFEDLFDVTAQIYYDRSEFDLSEPFRAAPPPSPVTVFNEIDTGEWWGAELQFNKKIFDLHMLTFGAEYRDDYRQERELGGTTVALEDRQSHGIYAQGDFQIATNLHLNAGARYDQYGDFDPAFNPRVAVIYNPADKATLKFIYGTAFRVPNFLELALAAPGQELEPEEITSYSIVYEQGIGQHWRASASPFYNDMTQLIAFKDGRFVNFDADTKGLELALEGFWTNALRARLSYTLQGTDSDSLRVRLPDSPEHLAKFNLSVPIYRDKVFAGLEVQYTSERSSLHTTTIGPLTVRGETAEDFAVVNFTLFSRELVKNLEFSGSIYNLFDQRYSDPATRFHKQDLIEQNGRTFRVKLTYRF